MQVGRVVAELIPNGATMQMGIGNIPDAVLYALENHEQLAVHSEMFSDGVIDLVERGIIDGSRKKEEPFQMVGSFVVGSKRLCDFINDNPAVKLKRTRYVNDPHIISKINKMHAINSCVEIDLTGQVCSDSIGRKIHSGKKKKKHTHTHNLLLLLSFLYLSGVGGQMDFMRGAALCPDGKAILAVTSRTKKGVPRIVPFLKEGAGVTMTRNHIHWVCTEYGAVNLFGMNLQERAELLISIAHPDDRAALQEAAYYRQHAP
jgi:acyl-CoA hydrolase